MLDGTKAKYTVCMQFTIITSIITNISILLLSSMYHLKLFYFKQTGQKCFFQMRSALKCIPNLSFLLS